MSSDLQPRRQNGTTLVDVLDRVLDKGLVVAGDIKVSVAEVELLTIRVRLVVCSIDKAQEIGLDWWRRDPYLSGRVEKLIDNAGPSAEEQRLLEQREVEQRLLEENARLREELRALRETRAAPSKGEKKRGAAPKRAATRKKRVT